MSLLIFRSCSPRIFTHELNLALTSWYRGLADHARSQEPLSHAIPKNRIKRPGRGGRNLRDRYLALEKSLRGKEALSKSRDDQHQTTATNTSAIPGLKSPGAPMFRGFVVPIEPSPPKSDECCMSGCAVCVYDLYEESFDAFKESVETLRKNLTAMNIPEHEWPRHIQTKNIQPGKPTNVVTSAFEEMERRLKEKHAAQGTEPSNPNTSGS